MSETIYGTVTGQTRKLARGAGWAWSAMTARRALPLIAALAGGLTLLIRLALARHSFDVLGDEIIYVGLGHSVVTGGIPRFYGNLFFLHPPGFFYLEAGWELLLGRRPEVIGRVYEMRTLNAVLAAATAVVLVLLVARVCSRRAAVVAGLLFAIEPFCIRQNDRVFLETPMMFWVLLGYLALTSLIVQPRSRLAWLRAVGVGVLFGCAVLTKDEAALLTVLPLLVAALLRWGPRWSLTLLMVGTTVLMYAAYVVAVAAAGAFPTLWRDKTWGFQRLVGIIQATGFNRPGQPSLAGRLIAEIAYFGTTYVILVLALPAVVLVLRRGSPLQRILGLLQLSATAALGYAILFGTLEEQELYLLIVPSLLILPVAATLLRGQSGKRRALLRISAVTALVIALNLNLVTFVQWRQIPDDGFARLRQYMAAHIPYQAAVTDVDGSVSRGITGYALLDRYRVGRWTKPNVRLREQVRYVVVPWGEVHEGYTYLTRAKIRNLLSPSQVVFAFHGRTYGYLALYLIPLPRSGYDR